MKNKLVTVFGGSGFLGRYVVEELTKQGAIVRVAVRSPDQAIYLRTMGQVGQVSLMQVDVSNPENVSHIIADSDYVVNLIGILFEKGRSTFERAHVTAASNIAKACAEHKVKRLVHVSAIGADVKSESKYASTKGRGEKEASKAYPNATIIRPSVLFGEEDQFYNLFACLAKISPSLPLVGGGTTLLQPVYVGDVAKVIVRCLEEEKNPHAGKVYELGGPQIYSLKEVMTYILEVTKCRRLLIPLPFPLATFGSYFLQLMPKPLLTPDQVKLLRKDNVVGEKAKGFKAFGIEPTAVEMVVPLYLKRFRYSG